MKLKPCRCGFEHAMRIRRSWWLRLLAKKRWLYQCTRCGARMFLPMGLVITEGAQRHAAAADRTQPAPLATAKEHLPA